MKLQKIEYPQLKKIGGFRSFFLKTFVKIISIVLIGSLFGWLSGNLVQKSFRDITGYNQAEVIEEVQQESNDSDEQELENPYLNVLNKSLIVVNNSIKKIKESDIVQSASDSAQKVIYDALKPLIDLLNGLLNILDKAAFWVPFAIIFLLTAWGTEKIIAFSGKRILTNGMDPQVIKNMEILEAKVKELVDVANANNK